MLADPVLALALSALAIVVSVGFGLWCLTRSPSAVLVERVNRVENLLRHVLHAVEDVDAKSTAWKSAAMNILDDVDEILDRSERKRKRASATDQRAAASGAGGQLNVAGMDARTVRRLERRGLVPPGTASQMEASPNPRGNTP